MWEFINVYGLMFYDIFEVFYRVSSMLGTFLVYIFVSLLFDLQLYKDENFGWLLLFWKERVVKAESEGQKGIIRVERGKGKLGRVLRGSSKVELCGKRKRFLVFKKDEQFYFIFIFWNLGVVLWCVGESKFIFKLYVG